MILISLHRGRLWLWTYMSNLTDRRRWRVSVTCCQFCSGKYNNNIIIIHYTKPPCDSYGAIWFVLFITRKSDPVGRAVSDRVSIWFDHLHGLLHRRSPTACWVIWCQSAGTTLHQVWFNARAVKLPITDLSAHTHPVNGPLSRTTQVSQYQKGKTSLDFTVARDNEWQWHQLGHMQVCTSLQTDNHASTPLSFFQAQCPSCRRTNSIKSLA